MPVASRGLIYIGRIGRVPLRMHWATPLVLFLLAGFRFVPVAWAILLGMVLVHELGHAVVVWRARAAVLEIDFAPVGGLCRWSGEVTPVQRACIAWGGVWAQMVALAAALAWTWLFGPPRTWFGVQIAGACIESNLWMMALNLLPVPPLDGDKAWALFPLSWRRLRALPARRRRAAITGSLEKLRRIDLEEDELLAHPPPEAQAVVDELLSELKGARRNP